MKEYKAERVPSVGEKFWFFDDGKISISRMYQAKVLGVYTPEEVPVYVKNAFANNGCDWIFKKDESGEYTTDVFIRCKIEKYDENDIWFARTQTGEFFSLNIQSDWQGGVLDIDGSRMEYLDSLND